MSFLRPASPHLFSLRPMAVLGMCLLLAVAPVASGAQAPDNSGQQMGSSVNTGGVHAAVLDAQHRPITAGGFVKSGPVIFEDISQQAGLDTWKHTMGTPEKNYIIETNGSGVGLIDYDNDGWLDIYLVNGSTPDAVE